MVTNPFDAWNQPIVDEFRANGGTVEQFGRSLVLLHHVGAKSGTARVSPVMGIRTDPNTWLVAGSKAGAPEHPAWFHNLIANPDAEIETPDDGTVAVRAEQLHGEARDDAWALFTAKSPGFLQYEQRTKRTIPVIALHRR